MLQAAGLSNVGCVRKNNEDFFHIDPDLGLYLVADGMGGAQAGELASQVAVETVVKVVSASPERNLAVLVSAFEEANRQVRSVAQSDRKRSGMGTTLVGVLECGQELALANVGDSRAYSFENGVLTQLTEDQTWANDVGRRLGLDSDKLKTHPMRHVLTMAIGVSDPLRVRSYSIVPKQGVLLLLCSDGLHGVVSAENISKGLRDEQPLEEKCHYLIEAAREAGGPDNITAVLLRIVK